MLKSVARNEIFFHFKRINKSISLKRDASIYCVDSIEINGIGWFASLCMRYEWCANRVCIQTDIEDKIIQQMSLTLGSCSKIRDTHTLMLSICYSENAWNETLFGEKKDDSHWLDSCSVVPLNAHRIVTIIIVVSFAVRYVLCAHEQK